jgi:four helix bundle protein
MFGSWFALPVRSRRIGLKPTKRSSKKDFLMRVKICRKEAKESRLFLRLIDTGLTKNSGADRDALASEARELTLIFSSIISKNGGS